MNGAYSHWQGKMLEQDVSLTRGHTPIGVRGWVYDGFGRRVVEQGVVASVTMITIDK